MLYIVFDFDGTLADTQKHHAQIESNFLKKYNIIISPTDITQTYAGRTPRERVSELLGSHGIDVQEKDLEEFETHKNEQVVALAKEGKIGLLPGVAEFLHEAKKDTDIIMGISSGASVRALEQLVEYFQLDIAYYTSADEVVHKKPAPDVFLKTFEKMGAEEISKKVVIGDGKSDVVGGRAAGAKTIFVNENPESGRVVGADVAVHSFKELSVETVRNLFDFTK